MSSNRTLYGTISATAPYGDTITQLDVKFTPEQPTTPSLMPETNSVYLSRPTEGTGELMELVGGTVAWNQLLKEVNSTNYRYNYGADTVTYSDGVATFTAGQQYGGFRTNYQTAITKGHVYAVILKAKAASANYQIRYNFAVAGSLISFYFALGTTYATFAVINKCGADGSGYLAFQDAQASGWQQVDIKEPMFIDLTQMFGSTIADYVYSLEQSTAGSGIAWLKKYDLIDDQYHAYSAPTLQSVEATAHVTVGFNQFDLNQFATDYPSYCSVSDGVLSVNSAGAGELYKTGCVIDIPLEGVGGYFTCDIKCGTAINVRFKVVFDDGTYTEPSLVNSSNWTKSEFQLAAKRAVAVRLNWSVSGTFEVRNLCINISKTTGTPKNGDYVPYVKRTYPTSPIILRGILKTDENGNLYYDGDTYEPDGTVTRNYGTRAYQAGDESLTDAITDGTNTVYKLNIPTTESADPFTAVQTVEDGGTEEFVTTNNVPVGVIGRFANAVPMEGVDSFSVTANDGTSHTYPVTLSEEIYRGYVDMLTGEAVSDMASIAEYNGETINAPWLSSLDVYSLGATPTRGAQVVYPITPEEVTATITGDPTELGEVTSVTSTKGTVKWGNMIPLGLKAELTIDSPF